MKANEFVKNFGWDRAKREVDMIGTIAAMCCEDDFNNDLKRLVESHELVEKVGGLDIAKHWVNIGNYEDIQKAIADVESCL